MARGSGVTNGADVLGTVNLEVGVLSAGVTGKCPGVMLNTGGGNGNGSGGGGDGGGTPLRGSSTFHKGSRDLGSKSR